MVDEQLVPTFVPALVVLLAHEEHLLGRPLDEDEVLAIRDNAICMMVPRSAVAVVSKSRRYDDIDPQNAWEEWQLIRDEIRDASAAPDQ